mgnify:CR=1 FL=1
MDIKSLLNWRYATKRMNGEQIGEQKLNNILESIQLSASSIGMQPYNVLVIRDGQIREQIKKIANNQPQITEASHLLVFAAWNKITPKRVDEFVERIAEVRNVSLDSLKTMRTYGENLSAAPEEQNFNWAARQAYIALGTALIAAAAEQVDATPMEGFDAAALDKLLGLEDLGLKSVILLPLGYRDQENDWLVKLPKVRVEAGKLFIKDSDLQVNAA